MSKRSDKHQDRPARPRGGEARAIADLVPAIGDAAFRRFGFVQSSLLTRWSEIAGERLARVTQPESLRFPKGQKAEGTLRLTVTSAAAPMVQHTLPELIARANRFFGYAAVARIQLIHGAVRRPQLAASEPRPHRLPAPADAAADLPQLSSIADPELARVLGGLASALAQSSGPPKIG